MRTVLAFLSRRALGKFRTTLVVLTVVCCGLAAQPAPAQDLQPRISPLDTNNAQVGVIVNSDSVQNLPLSGRGFTELASLTPGVAYAATDSQSTSLWYGVPGGTLNMIAKRGDPVPGNSIYLIDGIRSFAGPNDSGRIFVSIDAVSALGIHQTVLEEYTGTTFNKVVTSDDIDPSTGNPYGTGLRASAISKSGTHFFRGDAGLYMHPPGGSISPIVKFGAAAPGPQGGTIAEADILSVNAATTPQVLIRVEVLKTGNVLQNGLFQVVANPTAPILNYIAVSGNADSTANTFTGISGGFQNDSGQVAFMALNPSAVNSIYSWQPGASAPASASPNGTIPVPSGVSGGPGVLGPTFNLYGIFDSGNLLITTGVTGTGAFTDSALGRYNPFGSNHSFTMDAYDGQAAPGFSPARTFSKNFSSFSYSLLNDSYGFRNQFKELGYGLFYKSGTSALANGVADGQSTPLGGTYKLANTFRLQALSPGFRFSVDIAGGANQFADFQYVPPVTPGGSPTILKLWASGDALSQAMNFTYLGKTFSVSNNKIVFSAWHPGGGVAVFQKDRITGLISRQFAEFDSVGTIGYLGKWSRCSSLNLDSALGIIFRGDIRGGDSKIGAILQAKNGQLTSLLKTGDAVPGFTGWTYNLKERGTILRASFGRYVYKDSPVNPTSTSSLDVLGVYDPSLPTQNQIFLSVPGTIGSNSIQSLSGNALKFSYPYAFVPAQTSSGSIVGTSYLNFNLSTSSAAQVTPAGSLLAKELLRRLSSDVDVNSAGDSAYLTNLSPTAYGISLNIGGTTTTPIQDGQPLQSLSNFSLTTQNSLSAKLSLALDLKFNSRSDLLVRSKLSGGAGLANSAYARQLSGGSLQYLVGQNQSWPGFGVIGTIPTGTGGDDFALGGTGNATFWVPFTNFNSQNSRAILWFDPSGNGRKAFAAGDTLPSLNQTITDFGSALASDPNSSSVGVHATFSAGKEALLLIDEPAGTNSTSTSVNSTAPSATIGTTVTFTTAVANTSSFSGAAPGGTVAFQANGSEIGIGTLSNSGVATFSTSALGVGTYNITARYAGDANFAASLSNPFPFAVNLSPSSLSITSSKNPAVNGQTITLTATVTSTASGIPTGTVTLTDGSSSLGTISLGAGGSGTFAPSSLSVGTHSIQASYGGDSRFGGATSAISQVINQTGFAQNQGQPVTVAGGSTTTFNVVFFGSEGSSYNLSASNTPLYTKWTFTPNPFNAAAAGTTVQVSVNTNVNGLSAPGLEDLRPDAPIRIVVLLGIIGLVGSLIAAFVSSRPRRKFVYAAGTAAFVMLIATMIGCSSYNSGSGSSVTTPKGTTPVTITATPSGGGASQSTVVNFTVQ